ncbi:MAG: 3-dehydroquinate synthase [Ruminococcaceae bacterium]|nr:3-dehydroquinate synthase [Oscillospiraceae bacterium]
MKFVHVPASHPYDVCIGSGILPQLGTQLAALHKSCTVAVISDDTVFPLYGEAVCDSLRCAGFRVVHHVIPSGESAKNLTTYGEVLTFLAENRLTRTDLLLALGGGVVGDLTGFVAATFLRGIDYVQVPTTLLAAVDSSVGGKTAVDLSVGKNLVGAFHQPILVWCDTDTLATLPAKTFRDGCAEVIKYGLLGDADLFARLAAQPIAENPDAVIERCVEMKRDIVAEDEFDTAARQLLNLGHTFGHAIESVSDYTIPHGHCVAMGMAIISRAAAAMGICPAADAAAVETLLQQYGLPTQSPYGAEALLTAAASDKKMKGSTLTLAVPEGIGHTVLRKVNAGDLRSWLSAGGVQ